MMRIASFRIHQSLVAKPLKLNEYWPLKYMDKQVSSDSITRLTQEEYEAIKKRHGVN